jgi:hypothetical protein
MTSENALTIQIKKLLTKHASFISERDRHEKMSLDLELEEEAELAKSDLNDPVQFAKISQIRLKREIVPRKIISFQEAADDVVLVQLADELNAQTPALVNVINGKLDVEQARLAQALAPFFPPESLPPVLSGGHVIRPALTEAEVVAGEIILRTKVGSVLSGALDYLKNSGFIDCPVLIKAKRFMDTVVEIAAL